MLAPLLSLFCAFAQANEIGRLTSPEGLTLVFRASAVGNLTYQLDCLAGVAPCTRQPYETMWRNDGWTAEDQAAIDRWKSLMERCRQSVVFDTSPVDAALPLSPRDLDFQGRVRIAALRAQTWDEYASNLALLLPAREAGEALAIADRFLPRFETWWRKEGRLRAETSAAAQFSISQRKDLPRFYAKVARFYGDDDLSRQTVEFDFVAQPSSAAHHDSAEQLENYAVIEAVPGEAAEDRIDVVAHELFHYFRSQAGARTEARVIDAFAASTQPYAIAAYGALDESLAAAFGNGLVSRMVTKPEDFQRRLGMEKSLYDDAEIDAAAKALLPLADRWLAEGARIDDPAVIAAYLNAVGPAAGPALFSPLAWLRAAELVYGGGHEQGPSAFIQAMGVRSAWIYGLDEAAGREALAKHPALSAAVFIRPRDAAKLSTWSSLLGHGTAAAVRRLAGDGKPFVYGARSSDKAYVYVFVAPDAAARDALIAAFAKQPALFTGVMK